jgi:SET domain-containing protein
MAFEKNLVIKKSTLPGSGKGLFTKVDIAKGERIAEYKGKRMTWAEAQKLPDYRNGYLFYFTRNNVIDAWGTRKGVAHFANDARGIVRVNGIRNNSEYVTEGAHCFIEASRNIRAGEEILVGYGPEYWQVIRENLREEQKEARKKTNAGSGKKSAKLPHHFAAKRLAKH